MKTLGLMVTGLVLGMGTANAEVIGVMNESLAPRYSYDARAEFQVNEDPARAWVEVTITERVSPGSDRDPNEETQRIKLAGLKYNPTAKEISIASGGKDVICGRIVRRGFPFRYDAMEMTDDCRFNIESGSKEVVVDDGYRSWKEEVNVITIQLLVNER